MLKIIYDFDGTLTSSEMPTYNFFEDCHLPSDLKSLYKMYNQEKDNFNNIYEAFYTLIFNAMKEYHLPFDDSYLCLGADKIKYNPGVAKYLKNYSGKCEHYIVTSGIQNYIYHTKISEYFKGIYGTTFEYTTDGDIKIKDLVSDDLKVKKIDLIADNDFESVVYIGDGLTDVPAFKYVLDRGGVAILINSNEKVYKEILDKGIKVDYFKPDFKEGSPLVKYIDDLIYFNKALKFTKFKHGNQTRKQGSLYYTHPLTVAKMLKEKGFPIDYQVTGLFHDLLEDTDALNEEIFKLSNNEVLEATVLLTKEKGYNEKDYIERITNNEMARMVKLADRIHNLKESSFASKLWQKKYYKETVEWYVPMAKGTVFENELNEVLQIILERISK